jgi:protoporphyrinogen oxidase
MPETWNPEARSIGAKLQYRDFITVGLLYDKKDLPGNLDDNWIYIQEPGVKVGRVQVFNNWSPYLVANPETVWLGLEFFCREGDELWEMSDSDLRALGQNEMFEIGLTANRIAKDAVVIRVPKAYPGYFGEAYSRFDEVRAALDSIENLYPIGRNGMHRYNNQDHSMLTAKAAVEAIVEGRRDRSAIWAINIDDEYHEAK